MERPSQQEYIGQLMEWNTSNIRYRLRKQGLERSSHADWARNIEATVNELAKIIIPDLVDAEFCQPALNDLTLLAEGIFAIFDRRDNRDLHIVKDDGETLDLEGNVTMDDVKTVRLHQRFKVGYVEEEDRVLHPSFRIEVDSPAGAILRCSVRFFIASPYSESPISFWACYIGSGIFDSEINNWRKMSPLTEALNDLPSRGFGPRDIYIHPISETGSMDLDRNLGLFSAINNRLTSMLRSLVTK